MNPSLPSQQITDTSQREKLIKKVDRFKQIGHILTFIKNIVLGTCLIYYFLTLVKIYLKIHFENKLFFANETVYVLGFIEYLNEY